MMELIPLKPHIKSNMAAVSFYRDEDAGVALAALRRVVPGGMRPKYTAWLHDPAYGDILGNSIFLVEWKKMKW